MWTLHHWPSLSVTQMFHARWRRAPHTSLNGDPRFGNQSEVKKWGLCGQLEVTSVLGRGRCWYRGPEVEASALASTDSKQSV